MGVPNELISQLAKVVTDDSATNRETTVYGTIAEQNGSKYVKLDGSDQLTPVSLTTDVKAGERVLVQIKNHTAIVLGNVSSPSASSNDVKDLGAQIVRLDEVVADKVSVDQLDAEKAKIDTLEADNVVIKKSLEASEADIGDIKAENVEITKKLVAAQADISKLSTDKLDADAADIKYATIDKLNATDADIRNLEATYGEFEELVTEKFETVEADIGSIEAENVEITKKLDAAEADIEKLQTDKLNADEANIKYATIDNLNAATADIEELEVDYGEFKSLATNKLEAAEGDIEKLRTDKLDADEADITYATIGSLSAANARIDNLDADYGEFKSLSASRLEANDAAIKNLEADKLSAKDAELTYANIDFSNIGKAAIEYFYATSGLIKDVVVGDGTITGELVGVTIKGDLIEGNTIKAEKLVVKGEDGLYYKLNIEAGVTTSEQVSKDDLQNGLSGSVIIANTITAEKINVDDLVAFDATIGGFNITDSAIYSGAKESATNTTRGIYLDKEGQFAVGDASNFFRYFKDSNGNYKLEISAASVTISSSSKNLETVIEDMHKEVDTLKEEIATVLRIDSSRGTVFKNNEVSTILSAVIYRGSKRIADIAALKEAYGQGAYLEWLWQKMGESTFGTILSTDSRIGNDGFTFTLSPEDVDTKVVFMCQLVTD